MRQCLIVIDMQNGIFSMKRPVYRRDALVKNVGKAVRFARERNIPVVFSLHENNTFLKTVSEGHRMIDELRAKRGDTLIRKSHPDIFTGTGLEEILKRLGITSLIVAGVISNGCVREACETALAKGYSVTLVEDAHSTFYASAEKVIDRVNLEMERAGARLASAEGLRQED